MAKPLLAVLVAAPIVAGCSTLVTLNAGHDNKQFQCDAGAYVPRVYSGIFHDMQLIRRAKSPGRVAAPVIDVPFSAVADTLVLPYTIYRQAHRGNLCPTRLSGR